MPLVIICNGDEQGKKWRALSAKSLEYTLGISFKGIGSVGK